MSEMSPKKRREIASLGGKARAKLLSPERQSEIGRKAVQARWKKYYATQYAAQKANLDTNSGN
jgi:hypothetical protein